MTIHTEPLYGIAYVDVDTALVDLATASQQAATTTAAALARGGIAPPDATTQAQLGARATALEARATALEAPVGVRFTATQPAASVPGNTAWGPGTLVIAAQRGGWAAPGTADRFTVPAGAGGLYHATWRYTLGVAPASAAGLLQITDNATAAVLLSVPPTATAVSTCSGLVALTAGQVVKLAATTAQGAATSSASVLTLTRLGATL